MHATNRNLRERLLLSMLIPLVLLYGLYMMIAYHLLVLEPLNTENPNVSERLWNNLDIGKSPVFGCIYF
jgi:hypothetical protein